MKRLLSVFLLVGGLSAAFPIALSNPAAGVTPPASHVLYRPVTVTPADLGLPGPLGAASNRLAAWRAARVSAPIVAVRHSPWPRPAPTTSTTVAAGWVAPWYCIAQHESGGNPATDTGNGFYGGLQFSWGTWAYYAPRAGVLVANPAAASIPQQEAVAALVLAAQGWRAWPNTSRMCGY